MNSDLPPERPQLDRTLVILFSVLIVTLALLFVIAGLTWAVRSDLVGGPTATPTATQKATIPPTPDFRATRFMQDTLTKEAYEATAGPVTLAPTPTQGIAWLPIVGVGEGDGDGNGAGGNDVPPTASPVVVPGATITPTKMDIHIPVVANPEQTATVLVLTPEAPIVIDTPTALPSPTPPPPTITPTFTSEPNITPSPVAPTPAATPPVILNELRAQVINGSGATVRVGPGSIYSDTGVIANGVEIRLYGRTESGEWIYGCCYAGDNGDESFWVRQADAPPTGNDFGAAVPTGEPSDDVRWLRVQPLDPTLTPMPSPTVIPDTAYPLYRRDPSNQARVTQLPRPPVTLMPRPNWPYQAAQEFVSPVVVGNGNVLAHSRDVHFYSVDWLGGNQRWKAPSTHIAQQMPAIVGETIYVVDDSGELHNYALQNGELRWQVALNVEPVHGINIAADKLLIVVRRENSYWLMMRAQEDGDAVSEFDLQEVAPQYPAVGDQMVYIANNRVLALDIFNSLSTVWRYENISNATAPPLYIRPGVRAAAELYVTDDNNRVVSLDANTGRELWIYQSDDRVTGMAADETRLYLTGDNFVKAISRRDHEDLWREPSNGVVIGGPIIGDGEVLTLTENGDIGYWDGEDGGRIYNNNDVKRFLLAGAVAGDQIYVIGENGLLYGFQGGAR